MKKKVYISMILIFISLFLIGFYQPIHAGWCGEKPVLKFRFQVAEYDAHDYGRTILTEAFFEIDVNKIDKYGSLTWFYRVGGLKEYFGIAKIKCRADPSIQFSEHLR